MAVSSSTSSLSLFSVGTIDVNSLVTQLMTVESQPLTALQKNESTLQSKLSAYGQVSSAVSSMQSALSTLHSAATFNAVAPTVSGTSVSAVTAGSSGTAGSYTVNVTQLARGQSSASVAMDAATALGSGSLTLTRGTSTVTFDTGGAGQPATLADLRNAINADTTLNVRASLVGDGANVRLVLNSPQTGAANAFTVSTSGALAGFGFTTPQTAQDAAYTVNGLALTSASNNLTDVVGGVTLTLASTGTSTVTVSPDTSGIENAVKAFVDAYNGVNSKIKSLTAYNATTKTGAVLNGESVLRRAMSQLRSVISGSMDTSTSGDYKLLTSIGVQFQADGSLALNNTTLEGALKADPTKVARLFTTANTAPNAATLYKDNAKDGFAVRLDGLLTSMLDDAGLLGSRQSGLNTQLARMKDKETDMQAQLDLKQKRLVQQYSALNAKLQEMGQTSTALANALAALPK
jgi:flagellar hook-associated protein 2